MKKLVLISVSLLCGFVFNLNAQLYIKIDASFYSLALDTTKKVDIYLPNDYYENPDQQYATIYYLHGGNGNQNSGHTEAMLYYNFHSGDTAITSPPAIFVCPDGSCEPYGGSLWVNSELYGNYEDFVIQDVISFIESNFRALPDKNFRMITGTSMGGFGSAWLSVNYSDKFRACFPYIAAFISFPDTTLNTWRTLCYEENGSYNLNPNVGGNTQLFFTGCGAWSPNINIEPYHVEIPFDTLGNWVDTVLNKWYQFDISRKVKDLPGENELSWFLGCGTLDYMITYPAYQVFMDSLNFYDIGYDYNYFEGGHVYNAETWIKGLHWIDSIINHSYQTMGIEIIKQNKNQLMVYPNPVSDQTKIEFTLSDNKSVYFDLHNIAGKVVTSSNFGIISKGKHSVSWDTQNLPSGIYFLRLQVGNEVVTKKIIKL